MKATTAFRIGDRLIGNGHSVLVIAEAGVNHNGSVDLAHQLIDAAADSGADAIKFQTFHTESLVTATAPKAAYQLERTRATETQMEMLYGLELASDAWADLQVHAARKGILFLSTPFDEKSADLLAELGVPAFKLSSGDLTNLPLLRHVARLGRPVLASTGMAQLSDVEVAVCTLEEAGAREIALFHCVSCYPASAPDVNLRAMDTMAAAFGLPVGYSDHTLGIAIPLAAVARGAVLLEKHITLDRSMPGPDHAASADPTEFAALVNGIRQIEVAFGDGRKRPAPAELNTARAARRSIVARHALPKGSVLSEDDVVMRRPGTGISPLMMPHLLGRTTRVDIEAGQLLTLDMLS